MDKSDKAIKLKRTHIKALLLLTARKNIRYYLCGICFRNEGSNVFGYATDGHVLGRYLICSDYEGEDFNIIVERKTIKHVLALSKQNDDEDIVISLNHASDIMSVTTSNGSSIQRIEIPISKIDGNYPRASKIFNQVLDKRLEPDSSIMFGFEVLTKMTKISKILTTYSHKANLILFNPLDENANIIAFENVDDFTCAVMAMRISDRDEIKRAVIIDEYEEPTCQIMRIIDEGNHPICAVSHDPINRRMVTRKINPYGLRRTIVDYDDDCYIDSEGDIWNYAVAITLENGKEIKSISNEK